MAKDKIHYFVKEALIKNGWKITHDPYYLKVLEVEQEIDLGAEEIVAAELDGKKIAIQKAIQRHEIKIIVIDIINKEIVSWN